MAANYRSLVGGFFSSNPYDLDVPRSIRTNNPLALNISDWQRSFPGYAGVTAADMSPQANKTTIYETPEHGFAAWYELMRIYGRGGYNTVGKVINHYGGGQDYSGYLKFVIQRTGFTESTPVDLADDAMLLKFAKAMARHEAGREIPWSDAQILHGFKIARQVASGAPISVPTSSTTTTPSAPTVTTATQKPGFWAAIMALLTALFGGGRPSPSVITSRILRLGSTSAKDGDVWKLQERLRTLGFTDLIVDGEFGTVTQRAVRTFQQRQNLDPDGEVGDLTLAALNSVTSPAEKPPLGPPPVTSGGQPQVKPAWYAAAEKDIGWKERGNNQGIEYFINDTNPRTGSPGDPYCAIGINAWLGRSNVPGSGSAAARGFMNHPNFVKLSEPALGAIMVMWRDSPSGWQGHVYLYDGESPKGIRGIGANEDNMVKRSFHDRSRLLGAYWPKSVPLPTSGRIMVSDLTTVVTRSET